jgi:hypothetical protein
VERHGRLLTKDELLDAVWGHTVVTEGALTQVVIDLRRVLGDSQQRMIRTLRRRGYRFDCPVEALPGIEVDGDAPGAPRAAPGAPPADAAPAVSALRRSRLARESGLAVGLVLAVCGLWWGAADRGVADREPVAAASADRSIAVLPFADMSPGHDQEFFSEGLSEELLNLLAQVPGLRVIARTSSFSYKDGTAAGGRSLSATRAAPSPTRRWDARPRPRRRWSGWSPGPAPRRPCSSRTFTPSAATPTRRFAGWRSRRSCAGRRTRPWPGPWTLATAATSAC